MSETWTEYAVRGVAGDDYLFPTRSRKWAEREAEAHGGTLVGRKVTAESWLPVDTDADL